MSTPPKAPTDAVETDLQNRALQQLRQGVNPFTLQVTAVGTADESLASGVSGYAAEQFAELLDIIGTYREGKPSTRVFPLLGDRGSGKTHLLYQLRQALRKRVAEDGEETMVVVVDRLSAGMDPLDYLLWQIINHLLTQRGDGERMLGVIAGRLTGRLLAESLRQIGPHQRAELIPTTGWWDGFRKMSGNARWAQHRLNAIEEIFQTCDSRSPTPEDLRRACQEARLPEAVAIERIEHHLERAESKDVLGWMRKRLYKGLVKLALQGERDLFEELHAGDYEDAPANVKHAGNLSRRLLETWIELLTSFRIPVVLIFDQLEDYLRSPDPEQEKVNRRYFTGATSLFINELKHVCILIFAEEAFWSDLITNAEAFAAERLTQPFASPGRPAKKHLTMPEKVGIDVISRLVQHRVRVGFPQLDLTGLTPSFPFQDSDLQQAAAEPSIRRCLRFLAGRYDQRVYVETPPPKPDARKRLRELWDESLAAARREYGEDMTFKVSFIPEIQNAIQGWLECLAQDGLTGAGPWSKVEMLTDPEKDLYGNLCLIRTEGPHAPGIGIAAWLGTRKAHAFDLKQRIRFFDNKPCPVRTLVMLRADGEEALNPESARTVYESAIKAGRDVRIHKYDAKDFHSLMAFTPWRQAVLAEAGTDKDADPQAKQVFVDFLKDLSRDLLSWIDSWRVPATSRTGN